MRSPFRFILRPPFFVVALATLFFCAHPQAVGAPRPTALRCEYLENPLGIDHPQPRLSWQFAAGGSKVSLPRSIKQTAYHLLVASSPELLARATGDLWDSGWVATEESTQIAYAGQPLSTRARCYWKVRIRDQDGRASAWSEPAFWTMGLLEPEDWQARWITAGNNQDTKLEGREWIWSAKATPLCNRPAHAGSANGL